MLFMLNTYGLFIIYINLNDQINKRFIYVSCYLITNRVVFEFVNFNTIIIRVVFRLTNTIKNMYVDTSRT